LAFVIILFSGLCAAQLLATLQVWLSNHSLAAKLKALEAVGYFIIPGSLVHPSLTSFKASFLGGIFFTLTVGIGVTLTTIIATYFWTITSKKRQKEVGIHPDAHKGHVKTAFKKIRRTPFIPFLMGLSWIYLLFNLNISSLGVIESLYWIIIPFIVVPLTYRWGAKKIYSINHLHKILFSLMPIVVLTLIWTSLWDGNIFIRIRDHLLLETRVGQTINDFYYRYTLYPAEVVKPLSQKMLRTYSFVNPNEPEIALKIESLLRAQDYLVIPDKYTPDLTILKKGSKLYFKVKNLSPIETDIKTFLSNPQHILKEVSRETDTKAFFRRLILYSLIFGFPVALYAVFFGLLHFFITKFIKPLNATMVAAMLCFLIGLALFWPVWKSKTAPQFLTDLKAALSSEHFQLRVAALNKIYNHKLEIANLSNYKKSINSRHISERYWLAKALAVSKHPTTYKDLIILLNDPHSNVQCQVLYGLGNRNNPSAIPPIYHLMKSSDHWYIQWYGYRALRRLGWIQPRSKQNFF
jgi:hypothetical protein